MILQKESRSIYIDKEASSVLELVKNGLLAPVKKLMGKDESQKILQTALINSKNFLFPFILAPAGKTNEEVISSLKVGEEVEIICEGELFATLIVEEVFKIDPNQRVKHLYGTDDLEHPGVQTTLKRLGRWAVSGEYKLVNRSIDKNIKLIQKAKNVINAKHTTALFMAVNPLHRGHERLIRQVLDRTDLVVIFLLKPYENKSLSYNIRKEALEFFVNNFLPKNRVVIVPLENSYIFAGFNEIIVDAVVAKNYGCNRLTIGQNHAGLGMFYDHNLNKSIIDKVTEIEIDIEIASEYVYCDKCTTLVSKDTCPHGQHHHMSYHSESILELLEMGIMPPAVLVRKEISAYILSKIFPNRFKNLEKLYYDLFPVEGLLKEHTQKDFYLKLMQLYQTTSLT